MDDRRKAVAFMLVSALCFTFMSVFVKLTPQVPVADKVLFRNLVTLVVALVMVLRSHRPKLGSWRNQPYLLARSLLGVCGVACYFYAIDNLYLADAAMLNMLSPFVVAVLATALLRERPSPRLLIALAVAFTGGLCVIKPRFDLSVVPALVGLGSALFAGSAYAMLRFLRDREPPQTIVFHFSLITVVTMLPVTLLNPRVPSLEEIGWMLGIGITAAGGQLGLTAAYRHAPATEVSLYGYSRIILAAVLGLLIWAEIPDLGSLAGGLLIIGGGIFAYLTRDGE
jgi:drug/metabolite transporter (DMT)-like permease